MQKEHVIVYRETGKFAGWPANYGMWAWGDELVVGFTQCTLLAKAGFHARTRELPAYPLQARSLDGGRTWTTIRTPAPSPDNRGFSADEHMIPALKVATAIEQGLGPLPSPCPGDIDFTHPDFAIMCARTGLGGGTLPWFYLSTDRAHSWQGPYSLPMFGQTGIEARTDAIINGPRDCMLFVAAASEQGEEGKGVLLARTTDGGLTWEAAKPIYDPGIDAQTIGNQAVVLRDGSVLVFFTEFSSNGQTSIRFVKSTDHGATFGPPVEAASTNLTLTCTLSPDQQQYVRDGCSLFDVAADPWNGNLYIVWQDGRDRNIDRIAFSMSSDGGATWSSPVIINKTPPSRNPYKMQAFVPSVEVASGSRVFVTYYDFRNDVAGANSPELADYWGIRCNAPASNCRSAAAWGSEIRLTQTSFNILNAPYAGGYFLGDYEGLVRQGVDVRALFAIATTPGLTDMVTAIMH